MFKGLGSESSLKNELNEYQLAAPEDYKIARRMVVFIDHGNETSDLDCAQRIRFLLETQQRWINKKIWASDGRTGQIVAVAPLTFQEVATEQFQNRVDDYDPLTKSTPVYWLQVKWKGEYKTLIDPRKITIKPKSP